MKWMSRLIDLTGQRFGRLTVTERAESHRKPNGSLVTRWKCTCDCGNEKIISAVDLKVGNTKSCGCLKSETASKLAQKYFTGDLRVDNRKYNTFDLSKDYGIGYTIKGEKYLFDKEDYELIKNYCWYMNDNGYLVAHVVNSGKHIRLHRLIMNCISDSSILIDHINHNTLDNRKNNLRMVAYQQNAMNTRRKDSNISGTTGVSWDKEKKKWCATITYNYKTIFLGYYSDFDKAVRSRKQAEQKYFGEFSYANSMKLAKQNNVERIVDNG